MPFCFFVMSIFFPYCTYQDDSVEYFHLNISNSSFSPLCSSSFHSFNFFVLSVSLFSNHLSYISQYLPFYFIISLHNSRFSLQTRIYSCGCTKVHVGKLPHFSILPHLFESVLACLQQFLLNLLFPILNKSDHNHPSPTSPEIFNLFLRSKNFFTI